MVRKYTPRERYKDQVATKDRFSQQGEVLPRFLK